MGRRAIGPPDRIFTEVTEPAEHPGALNLIASHPPSADTGADFYARAVYAEDGELIEDTFIFGTPGKIRERLEAYVAGGITLPVLYLVLAATAFRRLAGGSGLEDAKNFVRELLGLPTGIEEDYIKRIVAVGGDATPERLVLAYSQGIFPWPHRELPLLWFSPDPRFVLAPGRSASLTATATF